MTNITIDNNKIEARGHAASVPACAMLTALTVSLAENVIERLGFNIDCILDRGAFTLDISTTTDEAKTLISGYVYSVHKLAKSYPDSFTISDTSDFLKS